MVLISPFPVTLTETVGTLSTVGLHVKGPNESPDRFELRVNQRSGSGRKTAKRAIGCANNYRRRAVKRGGWKVQRQRIYWLYDEENLKVRRTERRRKRVGSAVAASRRNQCSDGRAKAV